MTVHIMVLLYMCTVGCFIYQTKTFKRVKIEEKNKRFLIYAEVCLFFVFALRSYRVSLDGPTYYTYYRALRNYPGFRAGWEPLYLLINQIALKLDWYQFVIISTSLITCIGFGCFAYYNCEDYISAFWFIFFYITLNLYFNSMHLIRQICSMAICANIYTVLKNDQTRRGYIKSLILLLLGMGFHIMSLISLVYAVPVLIKKVSRKTIFIAVIISLAGMTALAGGQRLIILLIPRFARYVDDYRLTSSRAGVFSLVMIVIKLLILAFTLRLNPNQPVNQGVYRLAFITVFGTAFYILQFRTQFALRIGYYFEIFFPLYIPAFINRVKNRNSRFILYIGMFLLGLMYFIYMMKWGGSNSNRGCVPYIFCWE